VPIRPHRADAGQATVEFALLLPLFVSCVAVLVASIAVGLASLRLADTARVVARAASTSDNPSETVKTLLTHQQITHSESFDATNNFLTISLRQRIRIPLIGIPVPALTLSAESTVILEGLPVLAK
jgi:Flp pilus assembly protein TadG